MKDAYPYVLTALISALFFAVTHLQVQTGQRVKALEIQVQMLSDKQVKK